MKENISWFSEYEVAKHYKGEKDLIYQWKIIKPSKLLKINSTNKNFIKSLFLETRKKIVPMIKLTEKDIKKIKTIKNINDEFIEMSNNEKCLFEFNFIFGYISLEEQYKFLVFIKELIVHKIINIMSRHNTSLLGKINNKKKFYNLYTYGKKNKINRISLYELNKHVLVNLCKIIDDIDGIYQPNTNSFWYPDFKVYHMNIEEYILFHGHKVLKLNKVML